MYTYNPKRDMYPVDQMGFVNVREAYASGVVSGAAPVSPEAFNEASYDSMLNRPQDDFGRDRQQKYVRATLKAQAAAEAAAE